MRSVESGDASSRDAAPMSGPLLPSSLLPGFFVAGFECSSHRLRDGRRLDLLESTQHLRFVDQDYDRLVQQGIRCAREGLVWHRVERASGIHDFATALPILRASQRTGVRVIWDLLHFGWPDDLDVFAPSFVSRFVAMTRAFAALLASESDEAPWISPVNEMSFLAWAGGDVQAFNPFCTGRGFELKCQLARASIAAVEAFRDLCPGTRVVVHDPAFHVAAEPDRPQDMHDAEGTRQAQFQALDMLTGRLWPQLGGHAGMVDLIGVNYYPWNQWTFGTPLFPSALIPMTDPRYRPLSQMLGEWSARYDLPVYVGETGCEGDGRADWLAYVCDQVGLAREAGHRVEGVCLYPILNFPGWDDDRHCTNGLWDYADANGHRPIDPSFAAELQRRTALVATPGTR